MDDMGLTILIFVLLLILGGGIAILMWAAKKYGWAATLRYVVFAILIRVALQYAASNVGQTSTILVPLIGALVITLAWPHIVRQRKYEEEQDIEPPPPSD